MKFKPENKYLQIGLTLFFTAIAVMLAYFLFFRLDRIKEIISSLNKILAPITYGLVIAYLITPLLNTIERKLIIPLFDKWNVWKKDKKRVKHIRLLSVIISMIIVLTILYLFFSSVVPQLYSSIQNLITHYSSYTKNLTDWVNKTMDDNPDIAKIISGMITNYSTEADDFLNDIVLPTLQNFLLPNVTDFMTSITASVAKVVMFVWNIVIGLIISLYVLIGKEKFTQGFVRLSYAFMDNKSANRFIDSVRFTHKTFIGFFGGKVLDSFIIGIICYFCCLFMKMPYTVLISVIVGVTNIIPFFGPYIGAIPSTLIILLVDPKKALMFIILILIIQQLDGNLIGPAILSQSTGLSSFWIIFSITLFGGLFGILGMIIGVPVTAVIGSGIETLTRAKLNRKNLPLDPGDYLNVGSISDDGVIKEYVEETPKKKEPDVNSFGYKAGAFIGKIFNKIKKGLYNFFSGIKSKMKKNK